MEDQGYIELAQAVIQQAISDFKADVAKARYFVTKSPSFAFWCWVAEVNPERLRRKILSRKGKENEDEGEEIKRSRTVQAVNAEGV